MPAGILKFGDFKPTFLGFSQRLFLLTGCKKIWKFYLGKTNAKHFNFKKPPPKVGIIAVLKKLK